MIFIKLPSSDFSIKLADPLIYNTEEQG